MEIASTLQTLSLSSSSSSAKSNPETIKRTLIRKGVFPTPKIIHTLLKKESQKLIRKSNKLARNKTLDNPKPLSESEIQVVEEETQFQTLKREYREVMVGKPWERLERVGLRELSSGSGEFEGGKLKGEHLEELSEILVKDCQWLLDDDVEVIESESENKTFSITKKRAIVEADAIGFIINRLSSMEPLCAGDWKLSRLMNQSGLQFSEGNLLKIVGGLGQVRGGWSNALSVVEWVYNRNEYKLQKSRFVYTKLLAVLGKARMPGEALRIFNLMLEDYHIYPDMAAYHSISVTLGQAGLVKELMNVVECMRQKPSKRIKNARRKNWDPCLEPDVVVFNAVVNACVSSHQWKGVAWVLDQMRKSGLKPNGATYGLAMEVMLRSGKYELVHKYFEKMRKSGAVPKSLTYKVLVKSFWEEGKMNEAIEAVRDMEQRGVVGTASVYYELACCLCKSGRWREAIMEVEKMKRLPLTKPLVVTFTGMILSCLEGGHVKDCISVFQTMSNHCSSNIGTINAMLKVYGRNDMFAEAKELFEETKVMDSACRGTSSFSLDPDIYTYSSILEASAVAHQWEYFEYVYKEMPLSGFQIDQNKHAWLLVEASRAGKGHLLEHMFDTILEAGEIPHTSIFIEMVVQSAIQHNYERAVSLVNGMAHASIQVSEKQWTDIFMGREDQISRDGLQRLLDILSSGKMATEVTVFNLSKSLETSCGSNNSIGDGDSSSKVDNLEDHINSDHKNSITLHESSEGSITEATLDLLTCHLPNSKGSEVPLASDILKAWKESRNNDGIFFPFQTKYK
ncbi:hypothetical protein GIB67_030000 [Kingdonia uniflora]|uniref:Pentatricopeptide repeat-containing protein n=1 Tax=Kingdonia uniflora TaxID=39325 RepID=A0A7J7MYA3_9MAGN|nr:hypothetical protein GIB67_030000 [Kingdonia uniflora]